MVSNHWPQQCFYWYFTGTQLGAGLQGCSFCSIQNGYSYKDRKIKETPPKKQNNNKQLIKAVWSTSVCMTEKIYSSCFLGYSNLHSNCSVSLVIVTDHNLKNIDMYTVKIIALKAIQTMMHVSDYLQWAFVWHLLQWLKYAFMMKQRWNAGRICQTNITVPQTSRNKTSVK